MRKSPAVPCGGFSIYMCEGGRRKRVRYPFLLPGGSWPHSEAVWPYKVDPRDMGRQYHMFDQSKLQFTHGPINTVRPFSMKGTARAASAAKNAA
jgi:hypothetical protein